MSEPANPSLFYSGTVGFFPRPWRLLIWTILVSLLFFTGRLFILMIVFGAATIYGFRTRKTGGINIIICALIFACVGMTFHAINYYAIQKQLDFVQNNTPVDLSFVPNGEYKGSALGNNGQIVVSVKIEEGKIRDIKFIKYRDAVYAFDGIKEHLIGASVADISGINNFIFRHTVSLNSIQDALNNALLPALPGYKDRTLPQKISFYLTSNEPGRIAVNSIAILFIVLLTFDYFLQPTLSKNTGQVLNCYHCQGCVGVCPVKEINGEPYPLTMVVEARVGRYDKVARLAHYCVACGKCAGKCPVGISSPSVAAAAIVLAKEQKAKHESILRKRTQEAGI